MQTETIIRYYYKLSRIIKSKQKIDNTKYKDNTKWQGSGAKNSHSLPVEMQNGIATLEDSSTISYLSLPGFYPSRLTTYVRIETSMLMFIAAFP